MFESKAGEEGWPDTAKSRVFLPGTQVGQVPIFDTYTTAIKRMRSEYEAFLLYFLEKLYFFGFVFRVSDKLCEARRQVIFLCVHFLDEIFFLSTPVGVYILLF
jgi:hypothetical protein